MEKNPAAFIRRSVRRFAEKPINAEDLTALCEAALSAPSARNTRPWELFVIENRETLSALSAKRAPWKCMEGAAAAIVVAAKKDDYFEQNCAAATENILLTAAENGIGSVWLGLWPHEDIAEEVRLLLRAPEDIVPCCVVALGYPEDADAFRPIETEPEKIHRERW